MNGYIIESIRGGRVICACRYNRGRHATIQAARILADKTGDGVRVRVADVNGDGEIIYQEG